ncbi:MAG: hypothetical protein D4S02_04340 [Rhodocyclaceae bacterium]|nr:MAG: hypothetical protein D4S02_04340 [Rhodocyclaceae bacterium]
MNRRETVLALLALLAATRASMAQQQAKRIGLLWINSVGESSAYLQAFREGLRAQGYSEGNNLEIVDRFLVASYPQMADAAAKLVAEKVDVIVCFGNTAINAASRATTTIPIVFVSGTDPVKAGFALSLARPGKNITGVTVINEEIGAKRLELLKQAVPGLKLVAIPLNPESVSEVNDFKELEASTRSLGIKLRSVPVRHPGELEAAMKGAVKSGVAGFAPMPSTIFFANARKLINAIEKTGLPAIYDERSYVRAGGLMSYGSDNAEKFRHVAVIVGKILKGANPGDLPIEQPMTLRMAINLKTAKALGIKIPQSLLLQADEVIQ